MFNPAATKPDREGLIQRLISFMAAGMSAPSARNLASHTTAESADLLRVSITIPSMTPSHFSTKPAPTRPNLVPLIRAASLAVIAAALIAGCGKKQAGPPGGPGGPGGPMEVSVLTIAPAPVTLTQDLPGRISAFRVAEVRARVNGIVLKRLFTEGSDVTEGQVLYEIDPAPYQAALDSARGTLARAEANATTARLKEERYKQLLAPRRSASRTTMMRSPTSALTMRTCFPERPRCRRRGSISTTPK